MSMLIPLILEKILPHFSYSEAKMLSEVDSLTNAHVSAFFATPETIQEKVSSMKASRKYTELNKQDLVILNVLREKLNKDLFTESNKLILANENLNFLGSILKNEYSNLTGKNEINPELTLSHYNKTISQIEVEIENSELSQEKLRQINSQLKTIHDFYDFVEREFYN